MKTVRILLAITLLVFSYQTANGKTIHVPADSSTIQKGINGAVDGDIVLVDRGTYPESIDFLQKDILVASKFIIDSLEATIDSTIIDGGGIVITPVVTMRYVDGANSGITGFTITNGYAHKGGGIFCEFSSATISHNLITENTADSCGGGIHCNIEPAPTISNNRIIGNTSLWIGGGVFVNDCSPRIVDNLIESNEASSGGGIYVCDLLSSPEIKHNQILSNRAGSNGGGIRVIEAGAPTIDSNTINYNSAEYGGGIAFYDNPSGTITNNEIQRDTATCVGGGIYCRNSSPLIQLNTIINNSAESGGGISCFWSSGSIIYNTIDSNSARADMGGGGGINCSHSSPEISHNSIKQNRLLGQGGGGGGIYICTASSPTIKNNSITDNVSTSAGGGIYCTGSSPLITKNNISYNTAIDGHGGGIYFYASFPPDSILDNTISNNDAGYGAGMMCNGSSPTITGNYIEDNIATVEAGGIYVVGSSSPKISHNVISGNWSHYNGRAIWCEDNSSPYVENNTIDSNASDHMGGQIYITENSAATVKNNIISNSTGYGIHCYTTANPTIMYNDVSNNSSANFHGCPPGVGDTSWGENFNETPCDSFYNIIVDPLFDPESTNYALLCSSECIDAGDQLDAVPPDGGCFVDMGAVEHPYLLGDANGDGVHDIGDVVFKINYIFLGGSPPCPVGAADDNCDGEVDAGDIVSELNWLFPPPSSGIRGERTAFSKNHLSAPYRSPDSAEISLSLPTLTSDSVYDVPVIYRSGVDISAVQLTIRYNPADMIVLNPALTARSEGFTTYSSASEGTQIIGLVDLSAKHHVSAGTGTLLNLRMKGPNSGRLEIVKVILVGRDAEKIPVRIVSEVKNPVGDLMATKPAVPQEFSLSQNYPNPFNPETEISYELPEDSRVRLSIYNIRGQKVKTLVDGFEAAGHKSVTWDGKSQDGDHVASGVYFYRLEAGEFTAIKKMVLLR